MAEAVAGAIAYFATGTYVYGAAAYMGYAYVVVAASAIAYSGYASRKAEARARAAANASAKDREVMIRSAIAPRRIVYGRDRISGPIVYMESTGDKSQYLHMVVALAAHECDAIETVYFNEIALPDADGDGWITSGEYTKGSSTQADTHTGTTNGSGQLTLPRNAESITAAYTEIGVGDAATQTHHTGYSHTAGSNTIAGLPADTSVTIGYTYTQAATPLVRVRKYLGTADQTACADLVAESGGKWTSDHRGRGICYLYVRLEYDQDVFGSTGVPNISAVVRGKKVYDPRTTTTAWSNNAALCVADYLRSDEEGMRADSAEVPDSEIIAAANICDEEIDLSLDDEDVQARYTCDLSITTDRSPRDVLAELLACMSGRAVWTQGRWLVRPGAYRTPTLTITADMLAGPVSVMPKASRSELFNAVRATYRDATSFAELQAPLVDNSGYEAEDGGVQIVRQIDVPTLSDTYRAQRLAKIELERARQAVTVKLACNLKAYDLAPSDTVLLTLATYGWAAKACEVLERTLTREGTIQYILRETAAGVYDWAWGEATIGDLAPDTNLPNPFGLPAVLQNLAVDEDAIRLADGTIITQAVVTWDASESPFVANGGSIQYQTAKVGTPWGTGSLPGDATTVTLGPLQVGVAYVFRARAINASGRAGDWAYIGLVAEGLAAPPDDVTGLAYEIKPGQVWITWDPCEEADYAATELRYDGTGWADATFLWRGAGSDYQHPRPPNGTYIVRAKHLDTSGNYSVNAASISVTVDDSIDADGGGTLRLTTDRFPFFSFADGTTHTSASADLVITARRVGLFGSPGFTAEAFDAADDSLGTMTLDSEGDVCVLTAALFVSLGTSGSVRHLVVHATLLGAHDSLVVYRQDPTITEPRMYLSNPRHEVSTDADGNFGDYSDARTDVEIYVGIDAVTDEYEIAITPDAGLTATINGGAGPVSGAAEVEVAVSASTISDGVVVIDADDGVDELSGSFRIVKRRASGDAYSMVFDPRTEIVLPVRADGSVSSYGDAWTDVQVLRGTLPDTAAWALTRQDLGVVSTLVDNRIRVTEFVGLGTLGDLVSTEVVPATGWQRGSSATWCDGVWVMFGYHASAGYSAVLRSPDFEGWIEAAIGSGGVSDPHWDDVVLLLHGDGPTIVDSSKHGHTISVTGSSATSTVESKFGGSSIKGAASSYFSVSLGSLGSMDGDFTIEGWSLDGANNVYFMATAGGYLYNSFFHGYGGTSVPLTSLYSISGWKHWAISRSGGTIRGFVNGTLTGSISHGATVDLQTLRFGMYIPNNNLHYQGYYDDIRVTQGVGRYTADFTPPTEAFAHGATHVGRWTRGAYGAGRLVAIETGVESNRVLRSADKGLTWVLDTLSASAEWEHVHFGDGFLASAGDGTEGSWSADGDTWTDRTMPAAGCALAFAAPAWAAVSPAGDLYTSSDSGVTWSGSRNALMSLPAGNVVHRAVGFLGAIVAALRDETDHIKISIDGGASWFTVITPSTYSAPLEMIIVQQVLYIVSEDLTVLFTADGLTWREASEPLGSGGMADAIYGLSDSIDIDYLPAIDADSPQLAHKQPLLGTSDTVGFVRVAGTKDGELPLTRSLPVRRAAPPAEVFTSSATPPYLLLPATSDGVVTDYTNATITAHVYGNHGRDATSEYTWAWTATHLTPSSGTGPVATFTAMDPAEDRGQVTFVGESPGRPQVSGTLNVDKLKGGTVSGPIHGAAFNAFSFVDTYVALRFAPDGQYLIKAGSGGSFVPIGNWALPLGSQNETQWLRVETSGHALDSGTENTWLQMTANRDYVLSDASSGTHRTDLQVWFAADGIGTGAVLSYGALELRVP